MKRAIVEIGHLELDAKNAERHLLIKRILYHKNTTKMKKKIVNLICNKCNKLTTLEGNVEKMKCFFCESKNVETGWEFER